MRTILRACPLPLLALVLTSAATAGDAGGSGGSFHLLGTAGLTPSDASSDGRVVVGYNTSQFWYWTEEDGLTLIGGISPSAGGAGSAGVSDDGTRIGLTAINPSTGKTEGAFHDVKSMQTTLTGSFGFSCDLAAVSCWGSRLRKARISGSPAAISWSSWKAVSSRRPARSGSSTS